MLRASLLSYLSVRVLAMEWKPWLSRWSEEWVRSADPGELDAQVMHDRWLGFAPATSDAVAAAEAR